MSDTPETDAHEFYYDGKTGFVIIDFCRKMELERNEARRERDKLQAMRREVIAASKGAKNNTKKLIQAQRERDEAIAVMRETRRRLDDAWLEIEKIKNP